MTIASRLAGLLRRATPVRPSAAIDPPPSPPERWIDQFRDDAECSTWLAARRLDARLYADVPDARLAAVRERSPDLAAGVIRQADRILRHEFNLLGSGPYTPIDPHRPSSRGYTPIDWSLDPVSGVRFPEGFPHSAWNPQMRPGLADIKLPWELGRCQHWVTLGQAFRLSNDERYAEEVIRQLADFLEINPVGTGVQYTCTMDVAIRAVNWALAFELIRESSRFTGGVAADAYRSLFELGVFIERNLENKYEVTSNHFLSNVVGLAALGRLFGDLPAGRRWRRESRDWLEQEMRVQVLPDGGDYESSLPYHRLVAELFLSGARLAQLDEADLSVEYMTSLRRMIDLLDAVSRPDGLLPQIGDADDGRLHIFTEYGDWNPQDARHLFGPAAAVFGEPRWLAHGGEAAAWEAAWWGFDLKSIEGAAIGTTSPVARLFPDSGLAVVRTPHAYLIVTNGRVGTNGFGNHKHNDLLGFEFHGFGDPLFVDPGSYVYTSNPDTRNAFRGTGSHNTLSIDGVEQNDLKPDYLFRLFETSTVEYLRFDDSDERTEYTGRHTGYARLPGPVIHERSFRLIKATSALTITDRLDGAGDHTLAWHFHLAPAVTVRDEGRGVFTLAAAHACWRLRAEATLTARVREAWYSPSYGVRVPCCALDFTAVEQLSGLREFQFALELESRV